MIPASALRMINRIDMISGETQTYPERIADRPTPLLAAARYGHFAMVKLLLALGADITALDGGQRNTILQLSARGGSLRLVRYLIARYGFSSEQITKKQMF